MRTYIFFKGNHKLLLILQNFGWHLSHVCSGGDSTQARNQDNPTIEISRVRITDCLVKIYKYSICVLRNYFFYYIIRSADGLINRDRNRKN